MYFDDEAIAQLAEGYKEMKKWEDQFLRFISRDFKNEKAKEHAVHGYGRRLQMIVRSIKKVYAILPPERTDIPSKDQVHDATLFIQAFVINVFGSLENLAWIWVSERELKRSNGSDLPDSWVGLRLGNSLVRASFSNEFQEYLKTLDPWLDNLVDFRDALAHRIPLYIPPTSSRLTNTLNTRHWKFKRPALCWKAKIKSTTHFTRSKSNLGNSDRG